MPRIIQTFQISPELRARLDKATNRKVNPLAPNKATILLHGLDLALSELERIGKVHILNGGPKKRRAR